MNRKWNGFLPQNELIKLAWAALEASHSVKVDTAGNTCSRPKSPIGDGVEDSLDLEETYFPLKDVE